ncbi:4'-phosphopantetheinyl transferase superfamily protein [Rufibacter tibetensis]|uniref:Enterobactin synthase component D n=1 Tax=Rufibacter tibetensis TaxID=512763 RepID=A0A0P0C9X0_9BACT|nr:4'-phosphopantetheinyl transferase superfamily protein [Rufibacter tibetensis]ALI98266.1 hypothetical protein DC20_03810 [Rufibacter tibetensis]
MPLLQLKPLSSTSLLGLWQVAESIETLEEQLLSLRPDHHLPFFKAETRTKEWLAARLLAYTLLEKLGAPNLYLQSLETGEPTCSDASWQVSLTHSAGWVGALVSCSHRVGIDIEILGTKAPRLAPRFLNEEELAAAADDPEKMHLYWSAKETLYKVYRHRKLDFQENLLLQNFERKPTGIFSGRIVTGAFDQSYEVQYEVHPAYVLTYVLAPL